MAPLRIVHYLNQAELNALVPFWSASLVLTEWNETKTKYSAPKSWIEELHHQAKPDIVIALAGNKSDSVSNRSVKYDEALIYAEKNNLIFLETSAKNGHNVNDIFVAISKVTSQDEFIVVPNGIQLQESVSNNGEKKSGECCES